MYLQENKETLYQWEINQKVIVENELVKEVHFSNATTPKALVVEVVDGMAEVPNILLQDAFDIKAFGYCGQSVRECFVINVVGRAKPDDYVYTETEVLSYQALEERISALEEGGGGGADVDLSEYVKNTDYATEEKAGVIKVGTYYGIYMNENNVIAIKPATESEILNKSNNFRPITPKNLDYAVKSVGDGYYAKEAEVEEALDAILAIQATLIGGAE